MPGSASSCFDALLYDQRRPGPGMMVLQSRLANLTRLAQENPSPELKARAAALAVLIETVCDPVAVDAQLPSCATPS